VTEAEKKTLCNVIAVGCPLDTAAAVVGVELAAVHHAFQADAEFAKRLTQAAAIIEYTHVNNIKIASKVEKNWRASVWWLERCVPEKYGKRDPETMPPQRFFELRAALLAAINDEVRSTADRERLRQRLLRLSIGNERCDAAEPRAIDRQSADDAHA
jgi:hypothetical protein